MRTRLSKTALTLVVAAVGAVGVALVMKQRPPAWNGAGTPPQRVTVDPFRFQAEGQHWSGEVLAESLAARLAGVPGLAVRVAGGSFGPGPDLTVGGDISLRDGRLVITARLFAESVKEPLWTATYWRKDSLSPELVGDVSAGMAEAIAGHLVRHGAGSSGERRQAKRP